MKKVKIGILGLGAISGIYLKNLTKLFRDVEVAGIYDLVSEKISAAKSEYGIAKG